MHIQTQQTDLDYVVLQMVDIVHTLFKYCVGCGQLTFITETFEVLTKKLWNVVFVIPEYSTSNCMFT